jgi:hypothetical protein
MKFPKTVLPAPFIMGQLSLAGDAPPKLTGANGHVVILIPGGKYALGEEGSKRNPEHQSELKSFAIAEAGICLPCSRT